MSKFDYKWMYLAYDEAIKAQKRFEVPVGAVLIDLKEDKLISKSGNNIIKKSNPLAHAEIETISIALNLLKKRYLDNTAIYVTLEPCLMCAAAISEARIKKIYFGAYDKKKGAYESNSSIFNNKLYFKSQVYGGIFEEECSKLLTNFFKKIRSINK